jgi:hypothetical protein
VGERYEPGLIAVKLGGVPGVSDEASYYANEESKNDKKRVDTSYHFNRG